MEVSALKKNLLARHPPSTLGEGTLLKPLKEVMAPQSRSLTPQRVYRCGPKSTKKTQPPVRLELKPEEPRSDAATIRVQRKTLVFGKSPGPAKKKELVNLATFVMMNKTKPKTRIENSDNKPKKALKPKKKKKNSSSKTEIPSREEHSRFRISEVPLNGDPLPQKSQADRSGRRIEATEKTKERPSANKKKTQKSRTEVSMSLFDILQASAIIIQKTVRGYLCRQRLGRFLQSVLESAKTEGMLGDSSYSGVVTPLLSEDIPIKALDSGDSQSSSLVGNHHPMNPFEERSLRNLDSSTRKTFGMKTEYRESTNNNHESKVRTLTVKRPIKKIDVGVQAEESLAPLPIAPETKTQVQSSEKQEERKSKKSLPVVLSKKVVAVGTQVSFRALEINSLNFSSQVDAPRSPIKDIQSPKRELNSGREKLENFAKDEYKKWGQVDQLLHRLNHRIGKNPSQDVKEIFNRIEELANQSKYSIKNRFNVNESQQSLLSLSKTPTVKSLHQESENTGSLHFQIDPVKVVPKRTLSRGNSPIESPLSQKLQQRAVEKWPEVVDIHKSINLSDGRISENPLFESIDEKLDRVIQKEQKNKGSSLKWSGRCDVELSESVLRSVASDKEISLLIDQNAKIPSNRTLERAQSKESFIGPVPHSLAVIISGSDAYFSSGGQNRFNTPAPTEHSELTPSNQSMPQTPLLIKSKSKKGVIYVRVPEKAISPTEPELMTCSLEFAEQQFLEREKTNPSLDEINIALQTILDDLGGEPPVSDELLDASTKRISGSQLWNFDSPVTSARQKASDHTLSLLSDLVLQHIAQETATDKLWHPQVSKLKKKSSEPKYENLADKFKKIDELLSYDDNPAVNNKSTLAEGSKTPSKQDGGKKFNGYPENILDDNIEEDVGKSEDAQSDAETVYGIRTNFNAVNEYLNLLLKFLKERLPELKLPTGRHNKWLILQRIHNLESELKENAEKNVPVKSITIPKRPGKKERSSVQCFARTESPHLPLPANYFTTLEEDILVSFIHQVFLQGHEHHG